MPTAMTYIPPTDLRRADELKSYALNDERRGRLEQIEKAQKYYEGDQKRHLTVLKGEPDDNVVLNNLKISVDRTLQFLVPEMPRFEIDLKNPDQTPEEKWIMDFWAENGGMAKMNEVGQNGALAGHCFVRVYPSTPGRKFPRIVNLNPAQITVYWKADDIETVVWFEQLYEAQGRRYINDFVNNLDGSWTIYQWGEAALKGAWELLQQEEWPFAIGPVVDWPHLPVANRYYGSGEASNLLLDDAINLAVSEMMRINRYYAYPQTVGIGVDKDEIVPTEIAGFWAIENESANVFNLEMRGTAADFTAQLLQRLVDTKLAENRVVVLRGDIKDFQRVTNPGIRTVFMDALAKNELLRWTYGNGMIMVTTVAAQVAGRPLSATPQITWPDPLPTDDLEAVQVQEKEIAMGVASPFEIAPKRGYNIQEVYRGRVKEAELLALLQQILDKSKMDDTVEESGNNDVNRDAAVNETQRPGQ